MDLNTFPHLDQIRKKLLDLLNEFAPIRVYTTITKPGSGAHYEPGQQTIRIEFGTTVANIFYCLKVFKDPDNTHPIMSIQLPMNSTSYDLSILIAANTSYMFKIVPCDSTGMIVMAGSIGITSTIID